MKDRSKINRIQEELKKAGMTSYGFSKVSTYHLPDLIHDDEHINGVVYGRQSKGMGAVMLVATNKRVLYLDYKPLYKNADEVTYDVVAGVKLSTVGPFAGVVLHTRVQDYSLRYVNINCAEIFTKYIEQHLEKGSEYQENLKSKDKTEYREAVAAAKPFTVEKSQNHSTILGTDTAVLSTTGLHNEPHASVIHYLADGDENYYFIAKANSDKAQNILKNSKVALTIHHTDSLKTLLVKGNAAEVTNKQVAAEVYQEIISPKEYLEKTKLPPVTNLGLSPYVVFKITSDTSKLQDYSIYNW